MTHANRMSIIYTRYSLIEIYELVSLLILVSTHHNLSQKSSRNKCDVIWPGLACKRDFFLSQAILPGKIKAK